MQIKTDKFIEKIHPFLQELISEANQRIDRQEREIEILRGKLSAEELVDANKILQNALKGRDRVWAM